MHTYTHTSIFMGIDKMVFILRRLILFLWVMFDTVASIKVFEFSEGDGPEEVSTLVMEVKVPEVDKMSLCFSHRQEQSNDHTKIMFSIFEDKNYTKQYLMIGFTDKNNALWLQIRQFWYFLGLVDFDIPSWLNICIELRFLERKFLASVNGGNILSISVKEPFFIPTFHFVVGAILGRKTKNTIQFHGSFSNLNVFYHNPLPLQDLASEICNEKFTAGIQGMKRIFWKI